jgi:hypothetical protein
MTWSKENLTANARSIIERLEYFLPFLKENIEFFDIKESINISKNNAMLLILNINYKILLFPVLPRKVIKPDLVTFISPVRHY